MSFKPTYELPSVNFSANGKTPIQLLGLPEGRVTHIMLELDGVASSSNGAGTNVRPRQFAGRIAQAYLETELFKMRATGKSLWNLYKHMNGKSLMNSIVAVANVNTTIRAVVIIPFSDPRAASPNDTAMPSSLLNGKSLEIQWGAGTFTIGADTITVSTNTLLRATAFLIPESEAKDGLPAAVRIDYEDWSGQTALLASGKGGAITHLHVHDDSDDSVSLTEYERFRVQCDGVDAVDRLRTFQLVAAYNDAFALGGDQSNETEQLPDSALLFIPIITPRVGYKLMQVPDFENVMRADITGTATSARFVYRIVEDRHPAQEVSAGKKMGMADPENRRVAVKTLSKTDLVGSVKQVEKARKRLPVRLVA